MIRATNDSNSSADNQKNIITKCLHILKLMIEESEKRGTARIKSHSGLLKKKILSLKAVSMMGSTYKDVKLRLFGNTTIWELREIIGEKFNYCIDFLRIVIKDSYDIKHSDNGKTLLEMKVKYLLISAGGWR